MIRRALANGTVSTGDLMFAVPDPRALDLVEKAAWIELYYWGDDASLRSADHRWARCSTERLKHLLLSLQARVCEHHA